LGGQKTSKILRDFRQLSISIANISGMDPHIENRISSWSTTTPPTLAEKRWTLVHKQKSYRRACWRTLNQLCTYCISWSKFIRQVALLRAEFEPPKIVSAVGLAAPGGLTLGSAPYF